MIYFVMLTVVLWQHAATAPQYAPCMLPEDDGVIEISRSVLSVLM